MKKITQTIRNVKSIINVVIMGGQLKEPIFSVALVEKRKMNLRIK